MSDLIKPATFYSPDYCKECDTYHSIELYDYFNNPMRYSRVLEQFQTTKELSTIFDSKSAYIFRCRKCGREYTIDWTEGHPTPMRGSTKLDIFKYMYSEDKKV